MQIKDDGADTVVLNSPEITFNSFHKAIITYKDSETKLYLDGELIGTDTGCTIPTNLKQLNIGSAYTGGSQGNLTIKDIKYYKDVLGEGLANRMSGVGVLHKLTDENGDRLTDENGDYLCSKFR